MAIISYTGYTDKPSREASLLELSEYTQQTRALLSMLGDYWTVYYKDTQTLAQASSGSVAAISREYSQLLDYVLSSNILDIPEDHGTIFELLDFKKTEATYIYNEDGTVDSIFFSMPDVVNVEFLTTNLFESEVVLERGTHFQIEKGVGIYFYVDIFSDEALITYEYNFGDDADREVLLWACSFALSSTYIYERYGRFLYKKAIDSVDYKWVVSSLMRYYTHAKSVDNIRKIFDTLYGIPYARYANETITAIDYVDDQLEVLPEDTPLDRVAYIRITTTAATYYTYAYSTMLYEVGDTVPQLELFAKFNEVCDYISYPGWWEDMGVPANLVANNGDFTQEELYDIMDKILKYNTVGVRVNVTFDTYDTYVAQIDNLFQIIKNGFPVYLYPFITLLFRVVFSDYAYDGDTLNKVIEYWRALVRWKDKDIYEWFDDILDVNWYFELSYEAVEIWHPFVYNDFARHDEQFFYGGKFVLGWDILKPLACVFGIAERVNPPKEHLVLAGVSSLWQDTYYLFDECQLRYNEEHTYGENRWHSVNQCLDKHAKLHCDVSPEFSDNYKESLPMSFYNGRLVHDGDYGYERTDDDPIAADYEKYFLIPDFTDSLSDFGSNSNSGYEIQEDFSVVVYKDGEVYEV